MIKLIVGSKGSGKTKAMIDMINNAVKTTAGNIVVVEKGMKLTYDIDHAARLIDLDEYKIMGGEMLYGFIAGLMAGNYDITEIYIDGILKVLDHDTNKLGVVLDEIAAITGDSVRAVVTVSADEANLPQNVKKYL
jgi:ABC-type histidine transport system ATPase subunit